MGGTETGPAETGPTGRALLAVAVQRLQAAGVPEPAGDARRLLAHALGVAQGRLTLVLPDPVSSDVAAVLDALVARRAARVPVAQLTETRAFWGRAFRVTADVLDPRPETEMLVAQALARPFARVLDLGTGSGCILVTLLAERTGAQGVGLDMSAAALEVATGNARTHGVETRATFLRSDWCAAAEGLFDLIVSNPPYIALSEMADLSPEVRDHEPHLALTDGGDGLGAYRVILKQAPLHLAPGGRMLFEIGAGQGAAVVALARAAGFTAPRILPDLDGRDRVVVLESQQLAG
jgi:release factor glutamine methyltransferase